MINLKNIYEEDGAIVVKNIFSDIHINQIEQEYLKIANDILESKYNDWHDSSLLVQLKLNPFFESQIYDKCRDMKTLNEFSCIPEITNIVKHILGDESLCFNRKAFRSDLPLETKELAHWHQDYYYVKGNTEVMVVWIALHDMTWKNGCLSYMPKTHKLGIIEHNIKVGKKAIPSNIFHHNIKYLEMKKGDVVFFNTLLLHSSNMNFSNNTRYSIQYRYTPSNLPIDESMLGTTKL